MPHVVCYRVGGSGEEVAMADKISRAARQELLAAISERYRTGSRDDKRKILDEFVAVTRYHRKHAIRVLTGVAKPRDVAATRSGRPSVYDEAVRLALVVLWEASDRVCGKRLKPLLPILISALERHGHLRLDEVVRGKLLQASSATIDRLLSPTRASVRGGARRQKTVPGVRRSVPVKTFSDWKDPLPGFMEADLVAHCGGDVSGSFVHTLVLTDVATGWTECVALVVRQAGLVVEAVTRLRAAMPFRLRGFDTDNGTEFVNEAVKAYCDANEIAFTRSRPHRKNDQAWVEQKNGAVVRKLVGYHRLEGLAGAEALTRLYAASRMFVNFFQPSFKLKEKTRIGARVTKRYHAPATPCARLLALDEIPEAVKNRLREVAATLDPLRLLDEVRAVQHHLAGLGAGETLHVAPRRDADLDTFLRSLATAWHEGEVRPTHRAAPKARRDWRTRADPFEAVWPQVLRWLEAKPDRTAIDLLTALQAERPGAFLDTQVRTLQRRVKVWRSARARELVLVAPELLGT